MENISKDQGAGKAVSPDFRAKGLTNSAYASLVQELKPLTITRDQASLIHALLSHRALSIDDEIQRQSALKSLINSLA